MNCLENWFADLLQGGEGMLFSVKNPVVGHQIYLGWGQKTAADFTSGPFPLFSVNDWKGEQSYHWHWEHFESFNLETLPFVSALESRFSSLELSDLSSCASVKKLNFKAALEALQLHQRNGEAWVANLTHRLGGKIPDDSSARCLALQGFYNFLKLESNHCAGVVITDEQIFCSFSPETFLLQDKKSLKTFPIKGTGPEIELEKSKKEISELHMITDLMRNDLGQIAQSVTVERERYLTPENGFYHARAEICGQLPRVELSWGEYQSLLPAGSISGAPKHRVLQILSDLETYDRKFYTGTFGVRLNAQHSLFNILIRTLFLDDANNTWQFPVGAGVTIKSDAEAEWSETLQKAAILKDCLT